MKKYVIQIEITEGCDEFWEKITKEESTGCDEVLADVRSLLDLGYSEYKISLINYSKIDR